MASRKSLQAKFFAKFSEELNEDAFLCPLCHQWFSEPQMAKGELSIEDVPPRSVGQNFLTLTCKRCNNEDGSGLDAALKAVLSGKAQEMLLTLSIGGAITKVSAVANVVDGKSSITFTEHSPDRQPKHFEEAARSFENAALEQQDIDLKLSEKALRQAIERTTETRRRAALSIFRAAHLSAFHAFGYRYLLDEAGIVSSNILARRDAQKAMSAIRPQAIETQDLIVALSKERGSVVTLLPVCDRTYPSCAVLLPRFGEKAWSDSFRGEKVTLFDARSYPKL